MSKTCYRLAVIGMSILLLGSGWSAHAWQDESASSAAVDPRLMTTAFDPDQTYLILTRPKSVTLIQMAAEESVVTAVAGDTVNFSVVVSQSRNYVMVRPKYEGLTTSLTLITNFRNYPLTLKSTKEAVGRWYQRVQWTYPHEIDEGVIDDLKMTSKAHDVLKGGEERTTVANAVGSAPQPSQVSSPSSWPAPFQSTPQSQSSLELSNEARSHALWVDLSHLNTDYTLQGEADFRPLLVFDDGIRTYFKMPQALQSLPALFVLENGVSQLVNYTLHQQHLVAQGLHSGYVLKLADREVKVTSSGTGSNRKGFWERLRP